MIGATYKDIRGGDLVFYRAYAGRGLKGPEYREARGRAIALLCFQHHVVVGNGKRGDMGQVVDDSNFIRCVRQDRRKK